MDSKEVRRKVESALIMVYKEDFDLLIRDVNERSISHKLAEYLQFEFKDLKVDCEYNRHGDEAKMLDLLKQKCDYKYLEQSTNYEDTNAKTVYPDIIVHVRGTDANNLLVIEIKKSTNKDKRHRECDEEKLKAFTNQSVENPYASYHYKYGLFLDLLLMVMLRKQKMI